MKAFTTACALIAGVSAESHMGLPFASGGFSPVYSYGVAHHPLTYSRPVYGPVYTGVHHPIVHHPIFKREAEAEPSFTYQSKVTHPDEKAVYEYRVNVDQMGNGQSYQFQQQHQRNNMMGQHQLQNQIGSQMFGRVDQLNGQQMQYHNVDGMNTQKIGGQMDSRRNQMDTHMNRMDTQMNPKIPKKDLGRQDIAAQVENQMENDMFDMFHSTCYDMVDRLMTQHRDVNRRDQYRISHDRRMNNRMSGRHHTGRQQDGQIVGAQGNMQDDMFDMFHSTCYDMVDRLIEQHKASNLRNQYVRHLDERLNNLYNYKRMFQRQNEARRNMNNQHRMFKREAEPSFEYDVTAEHENNNHQMVSRNQQMMDVMTQPQQQIYHRNDQMNQINSHHMQYNMDNRMDGRMNQKEQMMQQRNQQMMNQFNNQRRNQYINQIDQHNRNNMDNRMDQMDSRRNQMDTHMNRMDTQMNQMHGRNDQRKQYNRNNQMNNQMHQRQFGDFFPGTFGFNRDQMQLQNNRFQQDQFRDYY